MCGVLQTHADNLKKTKEAELKLKEIELELREMELKLREEERAVSAKRETIMLELLLKSKKD